MFGFSYTFFPNPKKCSIDEFIERPLWFFIKELMVSGQARGHGRMVTETDGITWFGMCEERASLSPKHYLVLGKEVHAYIRSLSTKAPKRTILGRITHSLSPCRCDKSHPLALFSNMDHLESPLICIACVRPVPLYRLPRLAKKDRYGIVDTLHDWQVERSLYDWMYINCHEDEAHAVRQLTSTRSAHGKASLELRAELERTLRRRVYLRHTDLGIHSGRTRCPACQGPWAHTKPIVEHVQNGCRDCRLIDGELWSPRSGERLGVHPLHFAAEFGYGLDRDR